MFPGGSLRGSQGHRLLLAEQTYLWSFLVVQTLVLEAVVLGMTRVSRSSSCDLCQRTLYLPSQGLGRHEPKGQAMLALLFYLVQLGVVDATSASSFP